MWISSWKDAGIPMRKTWWCLPVLLSTAFASMADKPPLPPDPTENPVMVTSGFLNSHPDLRYRLLSMEAMREDRHGDAFKFFRRAAHFADRSEEHTSELQSLMRISYAVFCLKKKNTTRCNNTSTKQQDNQPQ